MGIGIFGAIGNLVSAQTIGANNSSLSIEQLQQIIENLKQQIQQKIQLISRLKPLETCGNGICRFSETAVTCPADCNTSTDCIAEGQYIIAHRMVGVDNTPVGPQICCAGLTKYSRSGLESVNNGKCVSNGHPGMTGTYLCVKCGDGICNKKASEDVCNCPTDCAD
jgi:hypothetical protein